jgi:hypothetical protein
MMSKKSELLDFLALDENVRYVLEILQRADDIRDHLIIKFLKELKCYLQERMPTGGHWEFGLNVEYRSIPCWSTAVPEDKQYLRYEVQQWFGDGQSHLAVCLGWRDDKTWQDAKVRDLARKQLSAPLKTAGLKKSGDRWLVYQYLRAEDSDEDFLASVLDNEDREALFRNTADYFWPLVEDTAKQVADTNKCISRLLQE